jgi:hypothetical protein
MDRFGRFLGRLGFALAPLLGALPSEAQATVSPPGSLAQPSLAQNAQFRQSLDTGLSAPAVRSGLVSVGLATSGTDATYRQAGAVHQNHTVHADAQHGSTVQADSTRHLGVKSDAARAGVQMDAERPYVQAGVTRGGSRKHHPSGH